MQSKYKTICRDSVAEFEEKKSKFLCFAKYVNSKSEIEIFLSNLKLEHPKARHICYAYRIIENEQIFQKSSDDGEPSGTAGKPILNIIEKNNLINVVLVVVRYFGGVKLGAGNLLRAYSNVSISAVENNITEIEFLECANLMVPYSHYANILAYLNKNGIEYKIFQGDEVCFQIEEKYLNYVMEYIKVNSIPASSSTIKIVKKY